MRVVKHPGKCKICGQFKDLTAEHVPPRNAFNSSTVKVLPFDEVIKVLSGAGGRLPWDYQGLHGKLQQGGRKEYCLCQSCNNNTGQWYMRAYTDFAKTLNSMILTKNLSVGAAYSFTIRDIYPLRLYKAMMTMLCDINYDCFGDESIREFLLNKEAKTIDVSKYSLHMFLVSTEMPRISGVSAIVIGNNVKDSILVSEMAYYPIGFALYIDKPKSYVPFGMCIDSFASFDYNEHQNIRFENIPYVDINSQMPADYRSKREILSCLKSTNT